MLSPNLYYTSVGAIDLDSLASQGVTTLLVDLDNTLLPRNATTVVQTAREFGEAASANGMRVIIVSNNWHAHVKDLAADMGFEIVPKALKPLPFAFKKGLALHGTRPEQAVVIGDQVFTDVLGAALAGIKSILVTPMTSSDLPHTLALRALERRVLAGRQPLA